MVSETEFTSEGADTYLTDTRMIKTKQFKCIIIGDMGVGKTSLLATHATGIFPIEHVPTTFGSFVGKCFFIFIILHILKKNLCLI